MMDDVVDVRGVRDGGASRYLFMIMIISFLSPLRGLDIQI